MHDRRHLRSSELRRCDGVHLLRKGYYLGVDADWCCAVCGATFSDEELAWSDAPRAPCATSRRRRRR